MFKKKPSKSKWKKYKLSILLTIVFVIAYFLSNIFFITKDSVIKNNPDYTRSYNDAFVNEENSLKFRNGSRLWIEYAQNLVKKNEPTPPESARFYAYIASVYADVLAVNGSNIQSSLATKEIINQMMPNNTSQTNKYFENITNNSSEKNFITN